MKPPSDTLDRLLNSAARATRGPMEQLPVAVEGRVLARWRFTNSAADLFELLPVFHRALACALALILVTAAWSYLAYLQSNTPELAGINSAINLALNP